MEVGDKITIIRGRRDTTVGKSYTITKVYRNGSVRIIDDVGDNHDIMKDYYELKEDFIRI